MDADKRMSAREAVERFVHDGDSFVFANCLYCMPLALTHELIRQRKKNLLVFQQGGIEEIDQLLLGGVIDRMVIAYNFRAGGPRVVTQLDRALKEEKIVIEEMTNHTLLSMMKAGAMGYPFMPVLPGIKDTDIVRRRGFLGDQRFAEIKDPFTGKDMLVVKGYNPDFALMHVQRADKAGNGQLWGAMINSKWASLAAKKVILSCEEIVDTDVIMSSPHLTIVPAHKVCAVVESPWGAHPSEVLGHYVYDYPFRVLFFVSAFDPGSANAWIQDWIYNVPDREAYIRQYVDRFGQDTLDAFRAKPFRSVPADYGSTFALEWDEQGYSKNMGLKMDEFIAMLDEKGVLIHGN